MNQGGVLDHQFRRLRGSEDTSATWVEACSLVATECGNGNLKCSHISSGCDTTCLSAHNGSIACADNHPVCPSINSLTL
ncbi:hypothetical protein C8R44DRAFT_768456 [Mycena epipterygia]|nr:hypothetical protein C8R44DRAFT_768456 [Mycena epipterygia]